MGKRYWAIPESKLSKKKTAPKEKEHDHCWHQVARFKASMGYGKEQIKTSY